jgi:hypothetical protein
MVFRPLMCCPIITRLQKKPVEIAIAHWGRHTGMATHEAPVLKIAAV